MQRQLVFVMRACWRWSIVSLFVVAGLHGAARAGSPPRVGILRFEGKGEAEVRVAVTQAVGTHGFALVGARALEEAARTSGKTLVGRENLAAIAKSLGLAAIVEGRVGSAHGMGTARVGVHGANGAVVGVETWSKRRGKPAVLARMVHETFWRRLGPALEKATGKGSVTPALVARRGRRHR